VSVVIPVRNGEPVVAEQLQALARQDFPRTWELVVGDNGSTDATRTIVDDWRDRLPAVTVVDASIRAGINVARNAAARQARGDVLLFTDADDRVCPSWVSAMVAVLARVDLATGPSELFDDRDRELGVLSPDRPSTSLGFLPFARGCNLGVRRSVFDLVGGFDEGWPVLGSDDIDFCWRAQLTGAVLGFSEDARVQYRQPSTPRRAFCKQLGYGVGSVALSRRYAPHGARRWRLRYLLRDGAALARDLPWVLSDPRRIAWAKRAGWVTGLMWGSIRRGLADTH
jgi:glycosyltransferase involved in cell wall biosynthesis